MSSSTPTAGSSSTESYKQPVIPNQLRHIYAYRYRNKRSAWKHHSRHRSDSDGGSPVSSSSSTPHEHPSSVRILTWNVDYVNNYPRERLLSVLRHLEHEVLGCKDGNVASPCVIMLQEMNASAFPTLLEDEWVQRNFYVAPITSKQWPQDAHYGLVTLVERSLEIVKVQILEFGLSEMCRGALMVDIVMSTPERESVLRMVNTHLESLPKGETARPAQMALLAEFLRDDEVEGGIIAGDMNAIGVVDLTIAQKAGLKDAWKKGESDERGYTWGYQGGGDFPKARLDKVLYLPRRMYRIEEPSRIGEGLRTHSEDEDVWASDHFGLVSTLSLSASHKRHAVMM
ncbi:hypothetical protein BDN72DRAFT_832590 [Pluteus cervinus]|uniref:Uncharacterized protein n=1 Tax=Pluteus cervinus TaxID=181527 RepID=A0ACD3BCA4_9AGAR|nr:hypothetical protein BDN72DRAFT_832590 [Pluteus cervinus]